MQAPLSLVGAAAGIAHWASGASVEWLVGALVLGALVPFTLVVITPINTRLLDARLDADSEEAIALLRRWARLHAVRTAISVAVFAGFLALATRH